MVLLVLLKPWHLSCPASGVSVRPSQLQMVVHQWKCWKHRFAEKKDARTRQSWMKRRKWERENESRPKYIACTLFRMEFWNKTTNRLNTMKNPLNSSPRIVNGLRQQWRRTSTEHWLVVGGKGQFDSAEKMIKETNERRRWQQKWNRTSKPANESSETGCLE